MLLLTQQGLAMAKRSVCFPLADPLQKMWVLGRWRTRNRMRNFAYQVSNTLHGKLEFFGGIFLLVMLVATATGGFFETVPQTRAGLDGLLLVGHLWLAATLSLMILAQLAKCFVKNPEQDPLATLPAFSPALAQHRVLAAMPLTTFGFVGLFFCYFWQPMAARLDRPWLSFPFHLFTTSVLAILAGVVAGFLGRSVLSEATKRRGHSADLIVNISGGTALSVFVVLLIAIVTANKYAVGILETLGDSIAVSIPIGMIPFAAALAADDGRWLALAGWLGVSIASALWAIRATYQWSFSAHRDIPTDLLSPMSRTYAPVFTGSPVGWLPAGVSAFWRKDIAVPYSREPKRYLFHQVNLLLWGVFSVTTAMALRNRGTISTVFADTVPVLITHIAMAFVAMQNGVNALGREGNGITWLRPIFSGPQLLFRKLLINLAYVLVHGVVIAFVLFTGSVAASLNVSFWILLAYALGAGIVFVCIATATGFLHPDFERSSSTLPGSTAMGKIGFLFGALIISVHSSTAYLLLRAEIFGGSTHAGLLVFVGVCVAFGTLLMTTAALRQYQRAEP